MWRKMFSSMTIASSTTNPTAMVSPISDRLSRLKPHRYIIPSVPTKRDRDGNTGNHRRPYVAQEQKDHHHHEADGDHQGEFDVADRGADGQRAVRHNIQVNVGWNVGPQPLQAGLHAIGRLDDVGVRLLEHQQQDGALAVGPGRQLAVLRSRYRAADVADADRPAVAVADDGVIVGRRGGELVVGVDRVRTDAARRCCPWDRRP